MIVHPWPLLFALVLLWLPRRWLRVGDRLLKRPETRRRDGAPAPRDHDDSSLKIKEEAGKPRNWLDLIRAAAGSFILQHECFDQASDGSPGAAAWIFILQAAICVVAVLIQMVRLESRLSFSAPIFFIGGLGIGILGWLSGLFAWVAIWVLNFVLPGPSLFLFVFSTLLAGFGVLFSAGPSRDTALAAGLAWLPVVFSLVTKRRLVQLGRKSTKSSRRRQ